MGKLKYSADSTDNANTRILMFPEINPLIDAILSRSLIFRKTPIFFISSKAISSILEILFLLHLEIYS